MSDPVITSYKGIDVCAINGYTTPYYYVPRLGRVNHFMTLRRLFNFIEREARKGKVVFPTQEQRTAR